MLRSGASRAAFRALSSGAASSSRSSFIAAQSAPKFTSKLSTFNSSRPQALSKPLTMALTRFQTTRGPVDNIDQKHESEVGKEKLAPHPEIVSADSSTHPIFAEVGRQEEQEKDTDMMLGIRQDLVSCKRPFPVDRY